MNKVKITCDSTCDLTKALYDRFDIHVTPLGVILGEEERLDCVNVEADDLYRYVAASGKLPKTSAVSIGQYADVFRRYTQEGRCVVHINISSELSSSHRNACLAAEEVGNTFVVDSRSLSSGSGLLVLLAAELAEEGKSAQEIAAVLNEKKEKLDVSFVLQTLDYLSKGGRCSSVTAFGANALKLRPEIQMLDGAMTVGRKYRGDREKTVLSYVRGRLEGRDDVDTRRIFITHSGVPEALLEEVKALVSQLQPFEEILISRAGSTISSHCGPNTLGVLFFRK